MKVIYQFIPGTTPVNIGDIIHFLPKLKYLATLREMFKERGTDVSATTKAEMVLAATDFAGKQKQIINIFTNVSWKKDTSTPMITINWENRRQVVLNELIDKVTHTVIGFCDLPPTKDLRTQLEYGDEVVLKELTEPVMQDVYYPISAHRNKCIKFASHIDHPHESAFMDKNGSAWDYNDIKRITFIAPR